jgi:hypothetical protein
LGGAVHYQFLLSDSFGDGFDGMFTVYGLNPDDTIGDVLLHYDGTSDFNWYWSKAFEFSTEH